ncbi:MAG: hypothetical protein WDN04_07080 [Rhodospirillales bacterium]
MQAALLRPTLSRWRRRRGAPIGAAPPRRGRPAARAKHLCSGRCRRAGRFRLRQRAGGARTADRIARRAAGTAAVGGGNAGRLTALLSQTSVATPRQEEVLAETGDGRVLARTALDVAAGAVSGSAPVKLPTRAAQPACVLRLAQAPGAGSVALLGRGGAPPRGRAVDRFGRGHAAARHQFLRRARAEPVRRSAARRCATLLSRPLSVLVTADRSLSGPEAEKIDAWVRQGGFLVRFAGPEMGAAQDNLLPEKLLDGDRQLGGAMSWSQPEHLAAFPPGPFAGLAVPAEVTVNRQVLAEPTASLPGATWAMLTDGTPLVTAAHHGAGEIVLFHVTANADWSNLRFRDCSWTCSTGWCSGRPASRWRVKPGRCRPRRRWMARACWVRRPRAPGRWHRASSRRRRSRRCIRPVFTGWSRIGTPSISAGGRRSRKRRRCPEPRG